VATSGYLRGVSELLAAAAARLDDVLDTVADRCATTLQEGGLIHLFGSGHSALPALDAFPRYGSYVGLHPLTDPRLLWHAVTGPGGVPELLWLERAEHYIENYLAHQPLNAGDVLLVYSHSGRNAAAIETAQYAAERGLLTVAVTSLANAGLPATHSSGRRLAEICDYVLDTGVPRADAIVAIPGWHAPLGAASTVVTCAITQELLTRTAARLADSGVTLPTFVAPTARLDAAESGQGPDTDRDPATIFRAYRQRLIAAQARALQAPLEPPVQAPLEPPAQAPPCEH